MHRPELRLVTTEVEPAELKPFPVATEADQAFIGPEYAVDFAEAATSCFHAGAYEVARQEMWKCPDPLYAAQVALDIAEEYGSKQFLEIAKDVAPDDQMILIQARLLNAKWLVASQSAQLRSVQ